MEHPPYNCMNWYFIRSFHRESALGFLFLLVFPFFSIASADPVMPPEDQSEQSDVRWSYGGAELPLGLKFRVVGRKLTDPGRNQKEFDYLVRLTIADDKLVRTVLRKAAVYAQES